MQSVTRAAVDSIRNGRLHVEPQPIVAADLRCKAMQENARDRGTETAGAPDASLLPPASLDSLLKPLTARQLTAINLLSMGKSVVATAASIKVDPSTVHRWKASSPLFIAELNRRQADLFDTLIVKMRLLMGKAVDELTAVMNSSSKYDRREVMWKVLALLKPQKRLLETGPTEPRDVIDAQIRAGRLERGEVAEAPIEDADRVAQVHREDRMERPDAPTPDEGPNRRCAQDEGARDDEGAGGGASSSTGPARPASGESARRRRVSDRDTVEPAQSISNASAPTPRSANAEPSTNTSASPSTR